VIKVEEIWVPMLCIYLSEKYRLIIWIIFKNKLCVEDPWILFLDEDIFEVLVRV